MYDQERFSQFRPKGKFNTRWYGGTDVYTDGDVEDQLIDMIMEAEPEDYAGQICDHFSWPVFYYLTHLRRNILNWYPFKKSGTALEIGCGLGAITNLLCEKCAHVTAVELSKRRAAAAWLRCRERENLEIIVGNLNDIVFEGKFDYITLIGVLEYQGTYTESENPFRDFLARVKGLLKPGGKLLIAIENKHGLKYWCGAREDHTVVPFDGINDYRLGGRNARTFSRKELISLLEESGLGSHYFYYPMPDYKLPTAVYSEEYLPKSGNMENMRPYYVPDKATLLADEAAVWNEVVDNGAFEFFANSFLVECQADCGKEAKGEVLFAALSSERKQPYRVGTVVRRDGVVKKFALEKNGGGQIDGLYDNMVNLARRPLHVLAVEKKDGAVFSPRMKAQTMEDCLVESYRRRDRESAFALYDLLLEEIRRSSDRAPSGENIFRKEGIEIPESEKGADFGPVLENGYIDMIARNCFMEDGKPVWFDQEWLLKGIPERFIFYKSISELYASFPWMKEVIPLEEAVERYDLRETWYSFGRLSKWLYDRCIDYSHLCCAATFRNVPPAVYRENIERLLSTPSRTRGV